MIMGIELTDLKFLKALRAAGHSPKTVLTLGKQNVWVSQNEIEKELGKRGCPFEAIGAQVVDALDIQAGPGVSWVRNLNEPFDDSVDKYSLIYDGGTLEHCSNYLQALENCLNQLHIGGCLITATPSSNFSGHGFWQLSQEFFFRVTSAALMQVYLDDLWLVELSPKVRYFNVEDPKHWKRRTDFVSEWPCLLYARLRRDGKPGKISITKMNVLQSDYAAQLAGVATPEQMGYIDRWSDPKWAGVKSWIKSRSPAIAGWLHRRRLRKLTISKNPCFRRIYP